MNRHLNWLAVPLPLLAALLGSGCNQQQSSTASREPTAATTAQVDSELTDGKDADSEPQPAGTASDSRSEAIAVAAKDALFTALSGRLMEVLQADGPAAAIEVCSQEAITIAQRVGQEHGVEIGRTSFRLRNPANAPRNWARPLVEARTEKTERIELPDGGVGMLFPIRLDVKCLMCHGGPDDILEAVKPELAQRYPQDQATGFQQGDLRGWFWVEVPAGAAATSQPADDA